MKCRICKRPVENTLYTPAPDIHGSCAIEADRGRLHPTLTPDTPSTEARHDPFCVMFGINDLMRGKESGCTCATRRSDTPSTEALTPERDELERLREVLRAFDEWMEGPSGPLDLFDRNFIERVDAVFPWPEGRAVRQEAADTSGPDVAALRAAMHIVLSGNADAARFTLGDPVPDYIAERIAIEYRAALRGAAE